MAPLLETPIEPLESASHAFDVKAAVDKTRFENGVNGHALPQPKQSRDTTPIAIVGMGMRLPGGAHDGEAFWDLLMNKKEGMIPIPPSRWNEDGFHDPHGRPGTVKSKEGNFLGSVDPAAFDAGFFSMTASQVGKVDPQQRILLEVVHEALENAGEKNTKGKNWGVYVGTFAEDWLELHAKDAEPHSFLGLTGHLDLMTSNRVSYEFDWTGPSMTIKTGCSASMICLDSACKALTNGDCETAIVGGTNLILSPALSSALAAQGVNSADGRCRSFDANASGYGRAEAVSALVVKRLDDALRDGNPIRAVIRATLANDDGRTPGITQPSSEAHEALIRATYASAGISEAEYSQTAFFECHGTGTPVGDPIEVNAVARVFGREGMIIGSVKSNVGHSEAASGNTSIIKAILAMEHRTIPPNVNFATPNPKIPWKEAKLTVPLDPIEWPANRKERVSVNSFGIGGSNAHVILDSASSFGIQQRNSAAAVDIPRVSLLLFSAKNENSLQGSVEKYSTYLQRHGPSRLRDLSYTLASRRDHYEQRTFAIAFGDEEEPLFAQPSTRTKNIPRSLIFVFTGQGAQWAEMGKMLMEDFPTVLEDIRGMDKILSECHTPPSWSILDELRKPKSKSQISKAEFSQPLCTAIQVALVNLLRTWGVTPSAVVGHSSGEIGAAYATGSITAKEALLAAYFRGYATRTKLADGAMAAVGLGADEVRQHLVEGVVIGCENSPNSTTISGDRPALETFIANLQKNAPEVFVRALHVDNAYHSHHMKAYGAAYEDSISEIRSEGTPRVPFFSSVTGKVIETPNQFNASYWRSNLENPVLFNTAVRNIIKADFQNPVYLEIGPHSALAGPLRQIFQAENSPLAYVSSLQRGKDDTESIYTAVANLWRQNVSIDLDALNPSGAVLTDLPGYSWDHSVKFWEESRLAKEWRERKFLPHETLGNRLPGSSHLEPTWRNMLRLDEVEWCRDHIVGTDIVFPAVGYITMAGEAIRQLTGRSDYTVRGVSIRTAMIINESKPNDVVTTLRNAKLTDTTDSDWWDFRITSFNGSTWNEHISGQVKAGPIHPTENRTIPQPDFVRKVNSKRWYDTMKKIGFTYGKTFQGLENISADPTGNEAVATVENVFEPNKSFFELHPCTVDKLLQLMTVTQHEGNPNLFTQLSMPTYFDEMYIAGGAKQLRVTASSYKDFMDAWSGDAIATDENGRIVYEMKGCRVTPLGNNEADAQEKPKNAVELVWEPDANFLDLTSLILAPLDLRNESMALEKYFFLQAIDTVKEIAGIETQEGHLVKFRNWLNDFVSKVSRGEHLILPDGKDLAAMSDKSRHALIDSMTKDFEETQLNVVAVAIRRVHENAKARWEGKLDTVELLMEGGVLTGIYAVFNLEWDYAPLLRSLGHSKPTLRVLEIGAGTGGTTTNLLDGLKSEFGERLYSKYSFTDISSGFFVAAKERFKDHQNIDYQVLDISKDPLEQGFEEGSYDLILAANVIHATPSLQETLGHVKKLLHPSGRLLLQEMDMPAKWMNFIMGGFPGWWLGEKENREQEPYITPERWDHELRAAGFTGVEALVYDNDAPYQVTATMVSSISRPPIEKKPVTFLYHKEVTPQSEAYKQAFENSGHKVNLVSLHQEIPAGQDIISILELENPFLHDISQSDFERFIKISSGIEGSHLLWLTHCSSMGTKDPRYAPILGFARTLRSEKKTSFTTFEIDEISSPAAPEKAVKIYEQIGTGDNDPELDPDYEYALSEGTIYSSRYHWFSVRDELASAAEDVVDKVLRIGQKGSINGLRWDKNEWISRPLKGQEVAIRPHTVGVNFRDILQTQGLIDGDDLGGECSGIVEAVGPDVKDFAVGDRVFMMVPYCFSNRVITTAELVAKMPDAMSLEEAATMPITFVTVIYALMHLRHLQKDDTILIHSACGGVGITAIQIAQMVGAKIFATVGSEEKVKFLMENYGIPREQIFDSHSRSFLDDVLAATKGRGVDIALNSLAGEFLHATWQAIAPFGTLMEIGKRDFYGHAKLDMMGFTENRSYVGIDARHMEAERPELCGRLLRQCAQLFEQGHVQPIRPIKNFLAADVADAFRYMQRGTHIGKITVRMPDDLKDLKCAPRHPDMPLKDDSSYLLVGGLGGIGRSLALSLVMNGAKNLIFLSRSGRSSKSESFIRELEVLGCNVQVFAGSVAKLEDVQEVAAKADKPIRGIIQLSMALDDRAIDTMTYEAWRNSIAPKVDGTWNLHHAIKDVDFFVLFSSVSGTMGQFGQANYAAANTFLDAFVQYRHSLGLAASVIDLGVMEDVGFVAESASLIDYFKFLSADILTEKDIIDIVRLAIVRSRPSTDAKHGSKSYSNPSQFSPGVLSNMSLSDPNNRIIWKRDRKFAIARNLQSTSNAAATTNDGLKSFLSQISSKGASALGDDTVEYLAKEIGQTLYGFMMKNAEDMDLDEKLASMGLDSLVGIELRNWCRQQIGFEVSILEIMQSTLRDLGKKAVESLAAKHT